MSYNVIYKNGQIQITKSKIDLFLKTTFGIISFIGFCITLNIMIQNCWTFIPLDYSYIYYGFILSFVIPLGYYFFSIRLIKNITASNINLVFIRLVRFFLWVSIFNGLLKSLFGYILLKAAIKGTFENNLDNITTWNAFVIFFLLTGLLDIFFLSRERKLWSSI